MIRPALAAALLLALSTCSGGPAFADLRGLARAGQTYAAVLVKVVDGDTAAISIPAWADTPFEVMHIRIAGIDTPESRKPPARCKAEVVLGKTASAFARTLVQPGEAVTLTYQGLDKYARLDGALTLPDGRDWATVMLAGGYARPYDGKTKPLWCRKPAPTARP